MKYLLSNDLQSNEDMIDIFTEVCNIFKLNLGTTLEDLDVARKKCTYFDVLNLASIVGCDVLISHSKNTLKFLYEVPEIVEEEKTPVSDEIVDDVPEQTPVDGDDPF